MVTHYDANDDHTDYMDGVLDPGDIGPNGSRYDLIVEYEAAQEEAFLASHGKDGRYGSLHITTTPEKPF